MIRLANANDIPAIKALMESEPGFWQDNWRNNVLEQAIKSADGLAFVYERETGIIGFACCHDLGFRAYLSELIVSNKSKGQGIGKQLVNHIELILEARGCATLIADVWKSAKSFYEHMGWHSPDVVLLRKKLKGQDQPTSR